MPTIVITIEDGEVEVRTNFEPEFQVLVNNLDEDTYEIIEPEFDEDYVEEEKNRIE